MTYDLNSNEVFSMTTIREVMDKNFAHVKFDKELCKRIIDFPIRFMNKNEDNSAFFGGVLMGVQKVRFYDTDREIWFDDVLRIDEALLKRDFSKVKYIDPSHVVQSDVFNHIPGYLVFRLLKETSIPMNIRHEAMVSAFMALHIKYLTSLLARRFNKYPAQREVAEAAFAALTYRSDIKTMGSWERLIRQRSEGIVSSDSIYQPFFQDKTEEKDYWSSRIVSDTQSRIRELINKYYQVYVSTIQSGNRLVMTTDVAVTADGEQILRDKTTGYAAYIRYLYSVAQNEQNFIKPELIKIVSSAMTTMDPEMLEKTLVYIVKNINQPRMGYIEKVMEESLLYAFDWMQSNKTMLGRNLDLANIIAKIRAKVMASKTEDSRVLYIRDEGERIVRDATKATNKAYIASCRTGMMLYFILRAICKQYYSR